MRAIYRHFGLTLTPQTESRMQAWIDAHPQKTGGKRYSPEDYGLTEEGLRRTFAEYRKRRGYANDG